MGGCILATWDEFQEDRKRKTEKDTCAHPPCLGEVNMAALLISGQLVPIFKGSPSEAWDSSDPRFPFTSGLLVANYLFPS